MALGIKLNLAGHSGNDVIMTACSPYTVDNGVIIGFDVLQTG